MDEYKDKLSPSLNVAEEKPQPCSVCRNKQDFENIPQHAIPAKKLLIFTNKRSGSSFMGEYFNRNNKAFYLFEPLFPFTRSCDVLKTERVETLTKIMQCKLVEIEEDYVEAFAITKHNPNDCLTCGICMYNRHVGIAKFYMRESNLKSLAYLPLSKCPFHLNLDVVSSLCKNASVDVVKILRICSMQTLEQMYAKLFYAEPNLYDKVGMIHLIRDPRAIVSSRLNLPLDEAKDQDLSYVAQLLCSRLEENLLYSDQMWLGTSLPILQHCNSEL